MQNLIKKCRFPQKGAGFTLVEVMIAVVVVGILTAIALPSYKTYITKSRRSAAQAYLMDVAQREQQYILATRSYTDQLDSNGLNDPAPSTVSPYYTVAITLGNGTSPTFTVTATPVSGTTQASDGTLTIDQAGNRSGSIVTSW
jgi:type IV pilus assembly protein PilE